MTNKDHLDNFIQTDYDDLCRRINEKVGDLSLTKEIFSNMLFNLYRRIDDKNHKKYKDFCSMVQSNTEMRSYLISCCLLLHVKGEFKRVERMRDKDISYDEYLEKMEDCETLDLREDCNVLNILESLSDEPSLELEECNKYDIVLDYYKDLPMAKQILFELLYVEELSGRQIHKLLNSKLKISESHIYRMISEFKEETLEALNKIKC